MDIDRSSFGNPFVRAVKRQASPIHHCVSICVCVLCPGIHIMVKRGHADDEQASSYMVTLGTGCFIKTALIYVFTSLI